MSIALFFWMILKFVMLFLLCALLIFTAFSALILFVPLKYKVYISYDKKLSMNFEAFWLFRIFKFFYSYNNSTSKSRLLIFNKKRFGGNKKKNRKSKEKSGGKKQRGFFSGIGARASNKGKPRRDKLSKKNKKSKFFKDKRSMDTDSQQPEEEFGGLKNILMNSDKWLIFNASRKLIKRLLNAVKPNKFVLDAVIGFHDPYTTGRLLGALAFFAGVNGLDIRIKGNFNGSMFCGETHVEGKLILWKFVWPIFMFVFTKPIWKIIKRLFLKS